MLYQAEYVAMYLENLSLNLSPKRRETLNSPPSLVGKGAGGLGFALAFPHDVKSQQQLQAQTNDNQPISGFFRESVS